MWKALEGRGRGLFQVADLSLAWKDWGNPRKIVVGVAVTPAEIRTGYIMSVTTAQTAQFKDASLWCVCV
jgi:hypothetical protein